jgi:hypothetical protein
VAGWPVLRHFSPGSSGPSSSTAPGGRRRTAHHRDEASAAAAGGAATSMVLFPKAPPRTAAEVLPFRTALSVPRAGARRRASLAAVQPVTVAYTRTHGLPLGAPRPPRVAWYGDMEIAGSFPAGRPRRRRHGRRGLLRRADRGGRPGQRPQAGGRAPPRRRCGRMTAAAIAGRPQPPVAPPNRDRGEVLPPRYSLDGRKEGYRTPMCSAAARRHSARRGQSRVRRSLRRRRGRSARPPVDERKCAAST